MGLNTICRSATIIILLLHILTGDGYPFGPPLFACMTRFPKHYQDLTWEHSGPSPFTINVSESTYTPLQNITITIYAADGTQIMGIQMSAHRKTVNIEDFIGTFVSYTPEEKLQPLDCLGVRHSQIGHKNNKPVDRVVLVWQAPEENVGDIIFKATFVKNYTTFWAWETHELETADPGTVVLPAVVVETPTAGKDDIDFTECSQKKGCFLYPRYCEGSDCDAALTYTKDGNSYVFEMMAKADGYVTMGLSKDIVMGNDNTITCTAQGGLLNVQNGFNPGHFNERVTMQNLTNLSVRKTSSHVMCGFTRPRVLGVLRVTPMSDPPEVSMINFDLEEDWHIMMSWGHVPAKTDVMGKHVELPVVTDVMVNFQTHDTYRGSMMSRDVQSHGSLMVIAWVLFAGLTVVIVRHYKDIFGGKMVCGAQIWFQLHRGIAVGAFLFTAISFVVIFVKLQVLTESAGKTHAIVGITVGVAVLLQVVAGVLRPRPDAKIRPVFRWCHRLLGQATHILAAANLYLAFNMRNTPKSMQRYGTVAVPVWIAVQVVWELVFEVWSCRKDSAQGRGMVTSSKGMNIQEPKTAPSTRTDNILLGLYFLTLITFTIVLLLGIFFF